MQHRDPVGDLGHDAEIMRDEQDRHAALAAKRIDELQDLRLRRDVERRGRFVGDEEFRLERERHGDHHPLPLAAREFVRVGACDRLRIRQADLVEKRHGAAHPLLRGVEIVRAEGFRHLVGHPHDRVEGGHRLLEHHADALAADLAEGPLGQAEELGAVEEDRACLSP